ncbi:hypothetical protein PG995_015974 [Apiospora arundinis]
MAAPFLSSSGPAELIVMIFQACGSIPDVLALGATCRHLRGVLHSTTSTIIQHSGTTNILAFDEALLAVRAIQVCVDAQREGKLPPKNLQLEELGDRPLTIQELPSIMDLDHCVHAMELAIQNHDFPDGPDPVPPHCMPAWSTHFRKAIYRSFIIGASLSRAYTEPVFDLKRLWNDSFYDDGKKWLLKGGEDFSQEHFKYLESFASYNMQSSPTAEYEMFGPLADWLVKRILSDRAGREALSLNYQENIGRACCCRDNDDERDAGPCPIENMQCLQHSDSHFVVWKLMQILWVSSHIQGLDGNSPYYSIDRPQMNHPRAKTPQPKYRDGLRKAHVVVFGQFCPEEIHTPQALDDHNEPTILAYPLSYGGHRQEVPYEDASHWNYLRYNILDAVFRYSGKPNTATDGPRDYQLPPLEFKIFEYILRHHFKARFQVRSFDGDDPEGSREFCRFLEKNFIFDLEEWDTAAPCDDEYHDGSGMLESMEPPLELTYQRWPY